VRLGREIGVVDEQATVVGMEREAEETPLRARLVGGDGSGQVEDDLRRRTSSDPPDLTLLGGDVDAASTGRVTIAVGLEMSANGSAARGMSRSGSAAGLVGTMVDVTPAGAVAPGPGVVDTAASRPSPSSQAATASSPATTHRAAREAFDARLSSTIGVLPRCRSPQPVPPFTSGSPPPTQPRTEETAAAPGVGVVVRRDRPEHVVDDVGAAPVLVDVLVGHDGAKASVQLGLHVVGGRRIVNLPDDHRHAARLALGHPADVVLVEPLADVGGLAQLTGRIGRHQPSAG